MRARKWTAFVAVLVAATESTLAHAQTQQPLPTLPAPAVEPAPPAPNPTPTAPPAPEPLSPPGPPPPVVYTPPPPGSHAMAVEVGEPVHGPRNALWLGGRLGFLAYGGGLYNNPNTGALETTGNFIRPGAALELDVGARLARHYIPYAGLELGFAGAGRRFDGTDTRTGTTFVGVGFRYVAGDIDSVAFVSDLSFGFRWFQASNSSGAWSAMGLELFRLGIGADIRLTNTFTLSPLVTISGGVLTDTSGNISFAPNQADGQTGPPFTGNGTIPDFAQANYYAFVIGCGAHFDLFGR